MTWHVWTDGSCMTGLPAAPRGTLGWGGWCAVVEHGNADDSAVLSGRVPRTTNVRMELLAATHGLSYVTDPAGEQVVLHTDCTTLLIVREWLTSGRLDSYRGRDRRWWRELAAQMVRLEPTLDLLPRSKALRGPHHRRAHAMAGAQARGGLRKLPDNAVPLEQARSVRREARQITRQRLLHDGECTASLCTYGCAIRQSRLARGVAAR